MAPVRLFTASATLLAMTAIGPGSPVSASDSSAPSIPSTSPSIPSTSPAAVSPQTVVQRFLDALRTSDLDGVLSTWAIDEVARGFDFEKRADATKFFLPLTDFAPNTSPVYTEINRQAMRSRALNTVRMVTYSLLSEVPMRPQGVPQWDAKKAAEFAGTVDPARLRDLKVLATSIITAPGKYHEQSVQRTVAVFSAADVTELATLVELHGATYALGFTLLRYGDQWKILDGSSPLADLYSLGGVQPMTPASFAQLGSNLGATPDTSVTTTTSA